MSQDPIAARIAEIAKESKARADAGCSIMGNTCAAQVSLRRRVEELRARGLSSHEATQRAQRESVGTDHFEDVCWSDCGHDSSDDEDVMSSRTISMIGDVLEDIIKSKESVASSVSSDQLEKLAEVIFSARPVAQWARVIINTTKRFKNFSHFHKATLRLMSGSITLYEVVRALGPDWDPVARALEVLAQQGLVEVCEAMGGQMSAVPIHALLRNGASLTCADSDGRLPAHAAASRVSPALGAIVKLAPIALLMQDNAGVTPLELMPNCNIRDLLDRSSANRALFSQLVDAAFQCLSDYPKQTAHVLQTKPQAAAVWKELASAGGYCSFLECWEDGPDIEIDRMTAEALDAENSAAHRYQRGIQRLGLLRNLASEHASAMVELNPEEMRLRLDRLELALREQQESSSQKILEQDKELRRVKALLAEREEDLLLRQCQVQNVQSSANLVHPHGPSHAPDWVGRAQTKTKPWTSTSDVLQSVPGCSDEFQVILDIRRARLADVDTDALPHEIRHGVIEMQRSLAAAVDRLAHDLYESQAHFMQELLQNADDNKYAAGSNPKLRFFVRSQWGTNGADRSQSYFFADNNEVGLSEADVWALCDISRSSKSASDACTTGYKGVGWKSVFRVCVAPHILSGRWRFRFNSVGLGMLTPEWIQDEEYVTLPDEVKQSHAAGNTVFFLPLNDAQAVSSIVEEMKVMEEDDTQLLFLHRIREIHFSRAVQGQDCVVRQEMNETEHLVRRSTTKKSAESTGCTVEDFAVQTQFEVRSLRGVTVAFPLVLEPPPQRLFAVLPVRAVGFHFAVQAPFHLTASRAELHRSPVNVQLRNAVAPAFLEACKATSQIANQALKYLGTEPTDVFWIPVRTEILASLQGIKCIATQAGLAEPSRCLMRGDDPVAALVPDDLLVQACGLFFVVTEHARDVLTDLGVQTFGFPHLVSCLRHDGGTFLTTLWNDSHRSVSLSKIYASLADALRAEPEQVHQIQDLMVFPICAHSQVSSYALAWSSSINLYTAFTDELPIEWQVHLVGCLHPELELSAGGWKLLHLLNAKAVDAAMVEYAAFCLLLRGGNGNQKLEADDLWASLAVLRRCFLLDRTPPKPWSELGKAILLLAETGESLSPGKLRLWSFLGVDVRLPKDISKRVCEIAGFHKGLTASQSKYVRMMRPTLTAHGPDWNLGWEVFLSELGCVPLDPTGPCVEGFIDVTLQLGSILCSGQFWQQAIQSKSTMSYLKDAFMLTQHSTELIPGLTNPDQKHPRTGATRRCWLRRLPVKLGSKIFALEDFFAEHTFRDIAGAHLPYVSGIPSGTQADELLQCLGVATEINEPTLLKCLHHLRKNDVQDVGLVADIYGRLGSLGYTRPGDKEIILVPGCGYVHSLGCSWRPFQLSMLQRCCRLYVLRECYERFGADVSNALQQWVREGPETDAAELCDALLQVIACARADPGNPRLLVGKPPVQPTDAAEDLFACAKFVVSRLAEMCALESVVKQDLGYVSPTRCSCFDFFLSNRMIVVPCDDEEECRLLHKGEAYWSVAPELQSTPLAAWALQEHYDNTAAVQSFFTEVLEVRSVLEWKDIPKCHKIPRSVSSSAGGVREGLDIHLVTNWQPEIEFNVEWACQEALQNCRHMKFQESFSEAEAEACPTCPPKARARPRQWRCVGYLQEIPVFAADDSSPPPPRCLPNFRALHCACNAFGLRPEQIAFAYDPSGACVCQQRLFLDYTRIEGAERLQHMEGQVTFWATELAHGIAHQGAGPSASENLLQVQSYILCHCLPAALQACYGMNQAARTAWGMSRESV